METSETTSETTPPLITPSTSDRYLAFLQSVKNRQRGFTNITKLLSKEGLSASLGTFMKKDGLIDKSNGTYKWIGPDPTIEMADKLVIAVNDSVKKYVKTGKESVDKYKPTWPKEKRKYAKSPKPSSDILNLSKLRQERIDLLNRIKKIENVLEVAAEMQ